MLFPAVRMYPCYVKMYITRASQWEAEARSVLHHPTNDYQHSRCRSLEALRLQQLGKPPQCFSCSWLSNQWMNITSRQRDLGVSVTNETYFSSQRDKSLKCEYHLQSKGGTRNSAICRYSFVRYERYSLTATINIGKIEKCDQILWKRRVQWKEQMHYIHVKICELFVLLRLL